MIVQTETIEMSGGEPTETSFHDGLCQAEDTALVELVQQGRREAFDEIDRRYRGRLCRFLARHATGPEHAEELAQQALVKAFLSIGKLRSRDRFAGWLYQIAFRLAVDENRRGRPALLDFGDAVSLVDHRSETVEPPDPTNLWQLARRVLKPDEYSAVWLKYVDGYKVDSIAKIMGRTRISVRVLLFRARKKLLPALSREMDD